MTRCPITYEELPSGHHGRYSDAGLRRLSRSLRSLADLPLTAEEQQREAAKRARKMSIQGMQPKLVAKLRVKEGRFEIVDRGGEFILKPAHAVYRSLPENEDLTMRLAALVGIETPVHGLVASGDGSWTYFIRRFDRLSRGRKLVVEDFAQLSGSTRDTKYDSSMEQVARVLADHATFPVVENLALFTRTLFSFLVGNEDMHLKNFSVIVRRERVSLSPAYDLLNSTIALEGATEEMALPIRGKKRRLRREDLVDYFAQERLGLAAAAVNDVLERFRMAMPDFRRTVEASFLPTDLRQAYLDLLAERYARMGW